MPKPYPTFTVPPQVNASARGPEEATKRFQQIQEAYSVPWMMFAPCYVHVRFILISTTRSICATSVSGPFRCAGPSPTRELHHAALPCICISSFINTSPLPLQERAWYDAHREQILRGDDGPGEDERRSSSGEPER